LGTSFLSTFQRWEFLIWATTIWKVLRKDVPKCLFGLSKSFFREAAIIGWILRNVSIDSARLVLVQKKGLVACACGLWTTLDVAHRKPPSIRRPDALRWHVCIKKQQPDVLQILNTDIKHVRSNVELGTRGLTEHRREPTRDIRATSRKQWKHDPVQLLRSSFVTSPPNYHTKVRIVKHTHRKRSSSSCSVATKKLRDFTTT
jgi:hypothetical protein